MPEYLVNRRLKIFGQRYYAGDVVSLSEDDTGDLKFIGAVTRLPEQTDPRAVGSTQTPAGAPGPAGEAAPEERGLDDMSVQELRDLAEQRGLDTEGTKKELRERLS